jgi:hypothetical protein
VRRRAFARKTKKFGIEVPKPMDVTCAFEIDSVTNTTHWAIAMEKEVKTVLPALDVKAEGDTSVPVGSQPVGLLTVFDVKMDMTRKVWICARGDQTDAPLSVTYASVVARESIRLGFLIAALNDLNVLPACRTSPHCVGTRIRGTTWTNRYNRQGPVWPQKCRLCLAHHVGTDPS